MSVLARDEIKERLKKPISDLQSLVITPLLDDEFDHDAVDLRLGCYFRLPAISNIECVRPYRQARAEGGLKQYPELLHKPYGRKGNSASNKSAERRRLGESDGSLILQPQHAVLASTLEYIKMPTDVAGEILTKSSWARVFISIASAPWIHPFYRGCLTLEITNLGNVPVALAVGEPIAQLVFMRLEGQSKVDSDLIEGSYAGAVMPEAPRFK